MSFWHLSYTLCESIFLKLQRRAELSKLTRFSSVFVKLSSAFSYFPLPSTARFPPHGNQVHEIYPLQFPEYYQKGYTSLLAGMMRERDHEMNREKGDRKRRNRTMITSWLRADVLNLYTVHTRMQFTEDQICWKRSLCFSTYCHVARAEPIDVSQALLSAPCVFSCVSTKLSCCTVLARCVRLKIAGGRKSNWNSYCAIQNPVTVITMYIYN